MIFSIERCSMNDGPGIRSTVFLKGCSLNCVWCHNPESKSIQPQFSYNDDRCDKCKKCKNVCKNHVHLFKKGQHIIDFQKCTQCGKCVDSCHFDALKIYGFGMTAREVFFEVMKDRAYYDNSNGGVTVSGGEPMMQSEFIEELFTLLQSEGIHTCIETSGFGKNESFKKLSQCTDLFLFDIKADSQKYRNLTGVEKKCVINNLDILCEQDAKIIIRCPLIPGINDTKLHFAELLEISTRNNIMGIEILPYHDIGKGKANQIGAKYDVPALIPDAEKIHYWLDQLTPSGKLINYNHHPVK